MKSPVRQKKIPRRITRAAMALLLAFLVTLAFVACDKPPVTEPPDPGNSTGQTTTAGIEPSSGYSFVYRGIEIFINTPVAPILAELGDPIHFFEAPSCAFQGLDKIYTYAGLEIQTYTEGDTDYVYILNIMDDTVSTPEGISLGASPEEVKAAYGNHAAESPNQLLYMSDGCQLKFVFADDELVSIEYALPVI
ncbi:MAG: hypothetical protein ACOX1U_05890 [Saccharofermentanales bacterium]|jgi:hypothetical protein|nr:hypothetical protein [Clostridiaceae bacterium]